MLKSVIFPLIAGAVLLLVYIIKCCKQRNVPGLLVKSFVSVTYILTAGIATMKSPDITGFGICVMIAGVLGLLGDVYLDQKWMHLENKDEYLNLGFTVFGIGHLIYIGAMTSEAKLTLKDFIIPAVCAIVIAVGNDILAKPMKQDFGKFRWIVFSYGAVVSFMMGTAISAFLRTQQTGYLIFAIAGVLFLFSDIILSGMYFAIDGKKNTPVNFIINIITYYLAQYLIAVSPLFIEKLS